MKLKNSYILLIVMAIFLLVSIGSVCASDITDNDVGSADSVILGNDTPTENTTQKIDTTVVSNDATYRDTESKIISVAVKDNESNEISISAKNLTVTKSNKNVNFSYNNSQINITEKLEPGKHNLVISYLGNDVYKNSTKNIVLSIFGNYTISTSTSVNVNSTKIVEVPVTITNGIDNKTNLTADDFNIILSYGNNSSVNITKLEYKNGKLIFDYPLLDNITSSNMTVIYNGENATNKTIPLNRVFGIKIVPITTETYYQEGNFTFKVLDSYTNATLVNKTVSVSGTRNGTSLQWTTINAGNSMNIGPSITLKTNEEGIASLPNKNFDSGYVLSSLFFPSASDKYVFTVKGLGDLVGESKFNAIIKQAPTKITVKNFSEQYGTTKSVEVVVVNKETNYPLYGIPINFKMTNSSGAEIVYVNNGTKVNVMYSNVNGTATLPMSNLIPGKYDIQVSVNGTDNIAKSSAKNTATIKKIPVKITTKSVTMSYNTGNTGKIKITNKTTGKVVPNAIISIKIYTGSKYDAYIAYANKKGVVTFKVPVDVGKHKMVVSSVDPRYSASSVTKYITVKKATAKLTAPKVTAYYKQGKNFIVKLVNTKKSNQPIYYAKVNLKIFISSTRYYPIKAYTQLDGKVKLPIDLNSGNYKVVVSCGNSKNYAAKQVTSKIVVKKAPTKLTPAKLTSKKGESKYFKVTVKNTKTKKVIKGVKVNIKVYTGKKYKTYKVKTNSKGIAKLNVKSLSVGTHKVVVTSANKYCVAKAAKSTIKITK